MITPSNFPSSVWHLDFSIWISGFWYQFFFTILTRNFAIRSCFDRSDPSNRKKILLLIPTTGLIFLEHFPYSWFEKFYRLLWSIVFLLIAVDFRNESFLIIRQFRRHLFSVLYTDRSGIHHLQ